jgi:hypothetical protein
MVVLLGNWQDIGTLSAGEGGDVELGRRSGAGGFRASRAPERVATWHLRHDIAVALRVRFGELSSGGFAGFGSVDVEVLVQNLQ